MALTVGTRIGPFEISGVLGAGGMGEVYRARDGRLGRDVALKVLPDVLAADPDRVARFAREAQVLASLNHPNIANIYGLEDARAGAHPIRALVLELVDGDTLAERISRGPIPVEEALPIVRQIAQALGAAHDQGVVHRDLKPANIKLTPDGVVKVLDFGLAKLSGPSDGTGRGPGDPSSSAVVTFAQPAGGESPTVTTPAVTAVGSILGTAAYMAPEQVKGRPADKRSDVWALGAVMYEMLTGARPFGGEDVAETLASVLRAEPDWTRVPRDVPATVDDVMRRCLEKDRRSRVGDVAAVLFALDEVHRVSRGSAAAAPAGGRWRRLAATAAWCLLVAAGTAAAMWAFTRSGPASVTRLAIAPDSSEALQVTPFGRDLAISRDGRRVAYVGGDGRLIVRSLDSLDSTIVSGLEGPFSTFFSPDGQSIGFIRRNSDLRVVPVGGGATVQRTRLDSAQTGGATWAADGRIVYATTNRATGLLDLLPGAATARVLTEPDRARGEADHLWPEFLPGGRGVLFTITQASGEPGTGQVAVFDFTTETSTIVVSPGTNARYVSTGHLVYAVAGALRAIRFDLDTLRTVGDSSVVVPSVLTKAAGAANFDVADNGTLVYVPGGLTEGAERELVWVARDGTTESLGAPRRAYQYPRISPDGSRVMLDIRDQDNDLWMWDLVRRTLTRVTDTPALDRYPVWTRDGKHIIFVSDRTGSSVIYRQAADGTGLVESLTDGASNQQTPAAVTRDGKHLLLGVGPNLALLPLDGSRHITPLSVNGLRPALSPDGLWIAYHSDESGQQEVYVRPFPNAGGGKWQVSADGGVEPLWNPKGGELFFVSTRTRQLMSVSVPPGPVWSPGPAKVVLRDPYFWGTTAGAAAPTFDVSADGTRMLMIRNVPGSGETTSPPHIVVVQNWFDELKRLLR